MSIKKTNSVDTIIDTFIRAVSGFSRHLILLNFKSVIELRVDATRFQSTHGADLGSPAKT